MRKTMSITTIFISLIVFSFIFILLNEESSTADASFCSYWKMEDRGQFIELIDSGGVSLDKYHSMRKKDIVSFSLHEGKNNSDLIFNLSHGFTIRLSNINKKNAEDLYESIHEIFYQN